MPKAVPLTHQNLLTNIRDALAVFRLGPAMGALVGAAYAAGELDRLARGGVHRSGDH